MNIGIDARDMDVRLKTGVSWYMSNLINSLADLDGKNRYFLFYNSLLRRKKRFYLPDKKNFERTVLLLPNILYYSLGREYFYSLWVNRLKSYINRGSIDVFHAPHLKSPFPCKAFSVVTINDIAFITQEPYRKMPDAPFLKHMFLRAVRHSHKIITISQYIKQEILNNCSVSEDKVSVIPYGIDRYFQKLDLSGEDRSNLRYRYGMPEEEFILYIGSIEPRKNLVNLIKAFSIFKTKTKFPHKLVLVGPEAVMSRDVFRAMSPEIRSLSKDVIFKGYISQKDLLYWYNLCSVFVFPSLYEGFGLPALEAMACGAVVIASNVSSLPEVVGKAGLLCDPYSPESIAYNIERALLDRELRDTLINEAREQTEKFSWSRAAQGTLDIYESRI